MEFNIQNFHKKFDILNKKGLPGLIAMEDKPVSLEYYHQKLVTIARDKSKFVGIKGNTTRKDFVEAIYFYLFIKHEVKHLFVIKPTLQKYKKVDETYMNLIKFSIPSDDRWNKLCEFLG